MNQKIIKLNFCNINNFGDSLNLILFSNLFNVKVEYASVKKADFMGIGSIIDDLLYKKREFLLCHLKNYLFNDEHSIKILSSGLGFDLSTHQRGGKYMYSRQLRRNVECVVLRGRKTKKQLEGFLCKKLDNVILGDGGLLCSELCELRNQKKYDLGIIPHYADANDFVFEKIRENNKNSIILNPANFEPIEFLKKLAECSTIISTGMHPLIAADSLGIPNLWARISEITTSYYKYEDYYSAFDLVKKPINLYDFSDVKNLASYVESSYDMPKSILDDRKLSIYKAIKKSIEQ